MGLQKSNTSGLHAQSPRLKPVVLNRSKHMSSTPYSFTIRLPFFFLIWADLTFHGLWPLNFGVFFLGPLPNRFIDLTFGT